MSKAIFLALACAVLAACNEKPPVEPTAPTVVATPKGSELWGGAIYGMTPDEVKSTSVEITDAEQPADELHNGAVQLLRRQDVVIANTKFDAKYFFIGGKLHQVTLALGEKKVYAEAEFSAKQIKEALTSKYGQPLSCDPFSGTLTKGYSCNWKRPDGNVVLFLAAGDELSPVLNVVYQVRLAQDADKL